MSKSIGVTDEEANRYFVTIAVRYGCVSCQLYLPYSRQPNAADEQLNRTSRHLIQSLAAETESYKVRKPNIL